MAQWWGGLSGTSKASIVLTVDVAGQDIGANKSTLHVQSHIVLNSFWGYYKYHDVRSEVIIDGQARSGLIFGTGDYSWTSSTSGWFTLYDYYTDVYHNADGTKSIWCSNYMNAGGHGSPLGSGGASGSMTLPTIPRKSSGTIRTGGDTSGKPITVDGSQYFGMTINKAADYFQHEITWQVGGKWQSSGRLGSNVTAFNSPPIPTDWLSQIPDATARGMMISLITYNGGGAELGRNVYWRDLLVPDTATYKPSFTATVDTSTPSAYNLTNSSIVLQGVSNVTYSFSNLAAGTYASGISSGYIDTEQGKSSNTNAYTVTYSTTGSKTATLSATDSRGRTTTKTSSAVQVYPYARPGIGSLAVARSLSNGTLSQDGTYAKVTFDATHLFYPGANCTVTVYTAPYGSTSFTQQYTTTYTSSKTFSSTSTLEQATDTKAFSVQVGGGTLTGDKQWQVKVVVKDRVNTTESVLVLPSSSYLMSIDTANGAVAFGTAADANKVSTQYSSFSKLDVGGPLIAEFANPATFSGGWRGDPGNYAQYIMQPTSPLASGWSHGTDTTLLGHSIPTLVYTGGTNSLIITPNLTLPPGYLVTVSFYAKTTVAAKDVRMSVTGPGLQDHGVYFKNFAANTWTYATITHMQMFDNAKTAGNLFSNYIALGAPGTDVSGLQIAMPVVRVHGPDDGPVMQFHGFGNNNGVTYGVQSMATSGSVVEGSSFSAYFHERYLYKITAQLGMYTNVNVAHPYGNLSVLVDGANIGKKQVFIDFPGKPAWTYCDPVTAWYRPQSSGAKTVSLKVTRWEEQIFVRGDVGPREIVVEGPFPLTATNTTYSGVRTDHIY